ncbi:MAG: patatin-like phospholipase family protein [Anaerolineae bacterium]|nr:patatin-like phospholipase family protein [Anaerolineae bacterium]
MNAADFTEHPRTLSAVETLQKNIARKNLVYSDVVDKADNQYVDLVMEGGGVLGIALLGYTYVMEAVGLRFLGIGGTSAGAINAMLLGAQPDFSAPKSKKALEYFINLDLKSIIDGDRDAQKFIRTMLDPNPRWKLARGIFRGVQIIDNLKKNLGLNPGAAFKEWMETILKENGADTLAKLEKTRAILPEGLKLRDSEEELKSEEIDRKLAFITAEITTETKVEFPKMASLFWEQPENVNPAEFVRASMSIPYFFHPYIVKDIPASDEAKGLWSSMAGYRGALPKDAIFVDGGTMSNFPINIFHTDNKPLIKPTLGVKLGLDRREAHEITNPGQFGAAIFNAARHTLDYDFISKNPQYNKVVFDIPTGPHNWLNFEMPPEDKIDLFCRGAERAGQFLRNFDWPAYRDAWTNTKN